MKRFITVVALFLIFSSITTGQRFNGGIIAGGLASQLDGDMYSGFQKYGYLAGGLVSLRLSSHSSVQFEMEYIQMAWKLQIQGHCDQSLYPGSLVFQDL